MTDRADGMGDGFAKGDRGAARESMLLMATLSGSAIGGDMKARVRNLSPGGMMAEVSRSLTRGDSLLVDIPRVGQRMATVAWYADGRAGFRFDHDVDPLKARRVLGGGEQSPVYSKSLTVGPRSLHVR